MTRIDFHSKVADKNLYTCRLIRKARSANCNMVVFHPDPAQLAMLDRALWSFSEADFLPHVMWHDDLAAQTPIILSSQDDAEFPHYQLLINLSDYTPAQFERFERMIEIVSAEEHATQAARERYRFYQQQAYALTHSVANS
jgi:DNA polymerase-3 subunit chi